MSFRELKLFWERAIQGGRKSIRHDELNPIYFMKLKNGCYVPYLDMIQLDLENRDN